MPASVELYHASVSSDSASSLVIPQFDTYLRILEHAYLGFFRERAKIEEVYIDSLRKLHRKAKGIDAYFESNVRTTCTMRAAWDKVRDNVEREAQVRQEFLTTLAEEIVGPLIALKGRTRERVKYDIKESAAAYTDFYKKIPKFEEAYTKKCQELEGLDPPLSLRPSNGAMSSSLSRSDLSSTLNVSSTLPSRQYDRNRHSVLSVSRPPSRMLSTSSSISQFTRQLIGGIRGSNRNVDTVTRSLLVREAVDQADKEYRGAIHQLESLRWGRISTLERAMKSLEGFVLEGTETAKDVLRRYVNATIKACTAHSKVATDVQTVIENISAENDCSALSASLQRSPALSIPQAVIYKNYYVGECPDLVFGRKLVDYATAQGSENTVPQILKVCIEEVNRRGLEEAGIYRLPGSNAKVKELQGRFERSARTFSFKRDDIHSIASLLKLYLRELPEPLFRFPLQDRIRDSEKLADDVAKISLLRSKIRELPTIHRVSLKALVKHLSYVASRARKNKMDAKSLASAFSLIVFGEDEIPRGDPHNLWPQDHVMEILIENADLLFEKSLPTRPITGSLPEPVNTVGPLTPQTSVASRQSEEEQAAGFNSQWSRRSMTTSISSSSQSCPPMSPSGSSTDSSGSPISTHSRVLSELPTLNFSALHSRAGAADLPEQRVSTVDTNDATLLRARELNQSQVFIPSKLAPIPEQQQDQQLHLEESPAYMPMSPQPQSVTDVGMINALQWGV